LGGPIYCGSFSPDGLYLLTYYSSRRPGRDDSSQRPVQVWDATTGALAATLSEHPGAVIDASFLSDGRRVVTVCLSQSLDGILRPDGRPASGIDRTEVRVWDVPTGTLAAPVIKNPEAPGAIEVSPDGRRLVTSAGYADPGYNATRGRVWDAATGEPVTPPLNFHEVGSRTRFNSDGRRLLTDSTNMNTGLIPPGGSSVMPTGLTREWDSATGEPITPPLPGERSEFSRDGRRALTHGPLVFRLWDLSPDNRPAEDLGLLAEALAGHRIDDTGGYVSLDLSRFRKIWKVLRDRRPQDFADPPGHQVAWHRIQAAECEGARLWPAAIWHLDRVIGAEPDRRELHVRRGVAHAELGEWDKAGADFARAIELGEVGPQIWRHLALVQLARGDTDGHRKACSSLLQRFRPEGHGPHDLAAVAWTCVLSPDGGPDPGNALALAEKAAEKAAEKVLRLGVLRSDYYARQVLAAALLRLARPEEAIQVLKPYIAETSGILLNETSGLLGTVAHHRLGHPDDARRLLDRVVLGIESRRRQNRLRWVPPAPWIERLSVELLRREAEALVKGAAGPPAASKEANVPAKE
jgi:tetratricopeptide (TPR) repeat protein